MTTTTTRINHLYFVQTKQPMSPPGLNSKNFASRKPAARANSTCSFPLGNRSMLGRRYRYSAATPLRSAIGTTTLSNTNPCTAAVVASSGLLKSKTASFPPGRNTRLNSSKALGISLTFLNPYAIVAQSNASSSNGRFNASPSTHSIGAMRPPARPPSPRLASRSLAAARVN